MIISEPGHISVHLQIHREGEREKDHLLCKFYRFIIIIIFFTCVCVQFAVVRLLGGVEMLLDQEGARHLAGGCTARITVRGGRGRSLEHRGRRGSGWGRSGAAGDGPAPLTSPGSRTD